MLYQFVTQNVEAAAHVRGVVLVVVEAADPHAPGESQLQQDPEQVGAMAQLPQHPVLASPARLALQTHEAAVSSPEVA